jgi:hypothetical protein
MPSSAHMGWSTVRFRQVRRRSAYLPARRANAARVKNMTGAGDSDGHRVAHEPGHGENRPRACVQKAER